MTQMSEGGPFRCAAASGLRKEPLAGTASTYRPFLLVESIDTDLAGVPLLTHRSRFAGERIQFVVEGQ